MKGYLLAVALLAGAALLVGCGSGGGAGKTLEKMLPRLVGPAQRYEVRVSGASDHRIGGAKVRASRLAAGEGLVLDTVVVDLTEVRFDRDRRELLGVDRADFSGILLQEDLNAYLRDRPTLARDLRVRITPGGAQLRGTADIPGVRLPLGLTPDFAMNGSLGVDDMGRLRFEPTHISVVGIEVPSVAAKLLASQINPLVDLTRLRLPIHLRSAELGPGEARLYGRALLRTGAYPDPGRE
ncbi:MAG: DUF2993 domain-containing protein [Armatimonadetes bacterium]|nr:DUF2993 domain-containing protein [Armatimonadota bacterium]